MIRKPTDDLQWWRNALDGLKPQITEDIQCGFFKRKLVKGGVFVPVRIWKAGDRDADGELIEDEYTCCDVDGRAANPVDHWVWCCTNPITEKEFQFLTKLSSYAKKRDPREPLHNPRKAVDPLTFRIPDPPKQAKKGPRK
jgi:hypothetical protein